MRLVVVVPPIISCISFVCERQALDRLFVNTTPVVVADVSQTLRSPHDDTTDATGRYQNSNQLCFVISKGIQVEEGMPTLATESRFHTCRNGIQKNAKIDTTIAHMGTRDRGSSAPSFAATLYRKRVSFGSVSRQRP